MLKPLLRPLLLPLLCLGCLLPPAQAETAAPLAAQLRLSHIAAGTWRADYVLAEPVASVNLGPKVGAYRRQAWRLLTPDMALTEQAGEEVISAGGKPFSTFSVEVSQYLPLEQGQYTAFDRFSDGGADVNMGFFGGAARQQQRTRPLHLRLQLSGLPGETVLAPDDSDPDNLGYAYFGPAKPVAAGIGRLILDPQAPPWMVDVLRDTTATISAFYQNAFQRTLRQQPLVMVSIDNVEQPGLLTKGGAIAGQLVYRLAGTALRTDTPKARELFAVLIAHELAHLWQTDVKRGGIGETENWIHEGGAEALSLNALRESGLFSQALYDAKAAVLLSDCAGLHDSVDSNRGYYACGFKRFNGYQGNIFALWKAMMEKTEASGEVYSTPMIEALLRQSAER